MELQQIIKKNNTKILTGIEIIGLIGTTGLAIKNTLKYTNNSNKNKKNKFKNILQYYWPTMLVGGVTIASIFANRSISDNKYNKLMSSYVVLDNTFKQYRKYIEEKYGKKTDVDALNSIAKNNKYDINIGTDDEVHLFYDEFSERYFEIPWSTLLFAEYEINRIFAYKQYVDVNTLYSLLGDNMGMKYGDEFGWSLYNSYPDDDSLFFIEFEHDLFTMDDGLECIRIKMIQEPTKCLCADNI